MFLHIGAVIYRIQYSTTHLFKHIMKKIFYLPAIILFLIISTLSCEKDDASPASKYDFIALHLEDASNDHPYLSLMRIRNGEAEFTHLTDEYPYRYDQWKRGIHQSNGILGFTLHEDLSERVTNQFGEQLIRWTGVWMDLGDGKVHELPTLNSCTDFGYDPGCDRYSYTQRNSVRIGKSGHVFYVAMSAYKAGGWHDEPGHRLVRLDPKTGEYEMAPMISSWTLSQPEIDANRYGLARISENIYPSTCGRYVYGRTVAWGISGGNLIASRGIMFRYDFDNEQYSRVNNVGYGFDPMYITADNNYLVYLDTEAAAASRDKKLNMNTGTVSVLHTARHAANTTQNQVNNYGRVGAGSGYPLREFGFFNVVDDQQINISVPTHTTSNTISSDGNYVYFRYRFEDTNYLLRTSDLTEQATVDTVAVLPDNVRVITIL